MLLKEHKSEKSKGDALLTYDYPIWKGKVSKGFQKHTPTELS